MSAESTIASATPDLDAGLSALNSAEPITLGKMPADKVIESLAKPDEAKVEPAPEKEEEVPEVEEEKPRARTAEEKSALERARTALRRLKLPAAVIDALGEEKVLSLGQERAKWLGEVDDAFRQLGELRKEKETWEKAKESVKPTEPAEEPLDFKALGKTLLPSMDEEAANAVVGHLETLEKRSTAKTKALEDLLADAGKANHRLSEVVLKLELKDARRELGERFPGLRDAREYANVVEKMEKLAPSGAYESVEDLMLEASILHFHDSDSRRTTDNSQLKERKNGLPTTQTRSSSTRTLSEREKSIAKLIELEKKHGVD